LQLTFSASNKQHVEHVKTLVKGSVQRNKQLGRQRGETTKQRSKLGGKQGGGKQDCQGDLGLVANRSSSRSVECELDAENGPECPKCGEGMVQRQAKTGKYAGVPFFGCSGYPKCRGLVRV